MQRRLQVEELAQLARAKGFSIARGEQEQFKVLCDELMDDLDTLEAQEMVPIPTLDAVRDPGRPPRPARIRTTRSCAGVG